MPGLAQVSCLAQRACLSSTLSHPSLLYGIFYLAVVAEIVLFFLLSSSWVLTKVLVAPGVQLSCSQLCGAKGCQVPHHCACLNGHVRLGAGQLAFVVGEPLCCCLLSFSALGPFAVPALPTPAPLLRLTVLGLSSHRDTSFSGEWSWAEENVS